MPPTARLPRPPLPPVGSSSYYALQRCPPQQRAALALLLAFHVQVRSIADSVSDLGVAHAKLAWWASQLDAMGSGQAEHPVLRALAPALSASALPLDALLGVIDSVRMDLEQNRWLDRAALLHYCARCSGQTLRNSAVLLGLNDPAAGDAAQDLGVALRLVSIIRHLGRDVAKGRIYLPLDALERHGVTATRLQQREIDANIRALLQEQSAQASALLDSADAALVPFAARQTAPLRAQGAMARALLREIELADDAVLQQRISLTPLRKLWISRSCTWWS